MAEVVDRTEVTVETPFGDPVGPLRHRHAAREARGVPGAARRRHRLLPSELNFRANIYGMKTLGVEYILSASAGRQLEGRAAAARHRHPGSVHRPHERGASARSSARGWRAHVAFGAPVLLPPSTIAHESGQKAGATVHKGGTYVCMEGPQISTLAGIEALSQLGSRHHRHDQSAGGPSSRARPRSATRRSRS
jgi:5'-methylthioadenosine phosphorylase